MIILENSDSIHEKHIDRQKNISVIKDKIEILNEEMCKLNQEITEMNSNELINRRGWPKTRQAVMSLIPPFHYYIDFYHEPEHEADIEIDTQTEGHVVLSSNPIHLVYYWWIFQPEGQDYMATCHNRTKKRDFYKEEIAKCEATYNKKYNEIRLEEAKLETEEQSNIDYNNMEKLKTAKKDLMPIYHKKYTELYKYVHSESILLAKIKQEEENIKLIYKILSDSSLTFMGDILKNTLKDDFITLVESFSLNK